MEEAVYCDHIISANARFKLKVAMLTQHQYWELIICRIRIQFSILLIQKIDPLPLPFTHQFHLPRYLKSHPADLAGYRKRFFQIVTSAGQYK